jgi:hypothetical protein
LQSTVVINVEYATHSKLRHEYKQGHELLILFTCKQDAQTTSHGNYRTNIVGMYDTKLLGCNRCKNIPE